MNDLFAEIDRICAPEVEGGLAGWCSPTKARWLADTILRENLIHVVEIGVLAGRSLLPMALAVKHLGRGGYVLGIDPYDFGRHTEGVTESAHIAWAEGVRFDEVHTQALAEIQFCGLQSHCGILRAASMDCASLIGPIDLLHVDGNHSVLASCRDVETWAPKVRSGGLIVLDDCEWPSVQSARKMLAAMCETPIVPEPGWEAYRKS